MFLRYYPVIGKVAVPDTGRDGHSTNAGALAAVVSAAR